MRLRLGRPLLAARARPWVLVIAAGCAVVVAVLGMVFAHQAVADPLDQSVDAAVMRTLGGHFRLLSWLITPGSPAGAVILTAILVAACLLAGRLNGALLAGGAVPVADGLCEHVLKPAVQRFCLGQGAYPSGHTTAAFALAAAVAVLLAFPGRPVRTRGLRVLAVAACLAAGVLVAAGMIALQYHYFTDTVGGAALGLGTVCVLALLLDLPIPRRLLARLEGQAAAWGRRSGGQAAMPIRLARLAGRAPDGQGRGEHPAGPSGA